MGAEGGDTVEEGRIFRKFVAEARLSGAYQGGICRDVKEES